MGTGHRVAMVVTPLVAVATLAAGMRVGAKRTVHAALVYGAPRAHGASAFAWQVITLVEEEGTRETEARTGVTVRARAKGEEATWRGDSNDDGAAEVRLELPGVERGDAIDFEVTGDGLTEPLAKGRVTWDDTAWMSSAPGPFLRPVKRDGAIALDVAILGERLVARSYVPVMVRATSPDDGHPLANVVIATDPEPEIQVRQRSITTCALGWARFDASAQIYLGSLGLHATLADVRKGEWFGSFPVATGTIHATVADVVKGDDAEIGVQAKTSVYGEVDDSEGRAFGGWAKLPGAGGDRATFHPSPLAPGLAWFVSSSEPHGAEILDEGATARPFLVAGTPMPAGVPPTDDACAVGAYLALHPAGGFRRFTALDGFVARKDSNGARRKRGLAIGLGALAIASVLELVLFVQAARSGRRLAADAVEGIEESAALMKRSGAGAGSVAIGVLVVLLGFALFAMILLLRS